ncbi:glycosyltransferase [Bacillus sp. JJ1521]|uniref:glycosyltransferase n=1 Tax=Bacillus sp. JJ1521 TaxID=3122957 RepID=UPI002FFE6260
MDKVPKRVLFVSGVPMDVGGIEKTTMEIYRNLDREKILIDFIVRKPQRGFFHDEIESYGGRILNLFERTSHKGNKKWNVFMDLYSIYYFYKILKINEAYSAIHIVYPHLDGFLIIVAKLMGIPVRIVHSRNTGFDDKNKPNRRILFTRRLRLFFCKHFATHIWGCSRAACQYLFGKNIMEDFRADVPKNPVKISDFINSSYPKVDACKELEIPFETINFINVGRYAIQKNQIFLLDFFAEMLRVRKDIHLILTGPGTLEEEIRDHIKKLEIEDKVTMLRENTNIPHALSASDYFLLPSKYEGFGNVLIEAQAAGLPCYVSDACQPEPNLGLVDYIPLEKDAKYWADYILSRIEKPDNRRVNLKKLMEYDVKNVAPRMQEVYLNGVKYKDACK